MTLPRIIAHRGASGTAPENTLPAFERAIQLGCPAIEADVRLSGDGIPVIFHDESFNRMTGEDTIVGNTLYSELAAKDIGRAFHPDFAQTYIMTFEELLDFFTTQDFFLNLEMKCTEHGQNLELVHKTIKALKRREYNVKKLLLSSFSLTNLQEARSLGYDGHIGGLMGTWSLERLAALTKLKLTSLNISRKLAHSQHLTTFKSLGLPLLCYTVNDIDEGNRLFDMGISGLFTDFPEKFIAECLSANHKGDKSHLNT